MKLNSRKRISFSRNAGIAGILLVSLALSGLFGCSKAEEYTVAVGGMETAAAEPGSEGTLLANEEKKDRESEDEDEKSADEGQEQDAPEMIYVDICGAVKYPGVYRLSGDARVFDAVSQAGGLTEEACERSINQAEKLCDGQKIYVPTEEEWESGSLQEDLPGNVSGDASVDDGLININKADEAKLCELPGVGESRARAIIQYREEHGDFQSIEEIQNVSGIKGGLFAKIKDLIKVQ